MPWHGCPPAGMRGEVGDGRPMNSQSTPLKEATSAYGLPIGRSGPRRDDHRQLLVAFDEAGRDADRLADDPDLREALEYLFPDHPQLQLGQAVADAAVDAEAERDVLARAFTV